MTKKEFLAEVADRLEVKPKEVEQVLDAMLFVLKEQLIAEDTVRLSDFGIFSTVVKKQRTIVNKFTGKEQVVPQKRTVRYKPSKYLKELVDFGA
ncbi:HU family DNA-binding protein [Mycoplasmopsis felis]|uniref:DNA-binding protein n=1 Tax=Mycoplasmopsis felis TaxID=33923 RepID=A0A809RVG8_9BACT|nr:HU family DNA-binding protein [Mycoplasmopsis felis]MCU9931400.1 HU family DNA-binding protein [Mycoplasmopsis felis]MCU9937332.1 HU family DNA-binding protein [Mycoplasmopsis felis]UWV78971.1 HU family DNA-binding protein [Mycoplasmopsis felis]UWV84333.1 HU family DNA-binding protein [Mycoplasmopsis felis]WAM01800.1 HU family DNA-binding protein [Mycoplasmopsis felis]